MPQEKHYYRAGGTIESVEFAWDSKLETLNVVEEALPMFGEFSKFQVCTTSTLSMAMGGVFSISENIQPIEKQFHNLRCLSENPESFLL